MAKRTVTADEYTCNNPECGVVVLATKDEPPLGFWGRVNGVFDGGGGSADWWADKPECIGPAIMAALAVR